jgi:hypothetical protein
MGRYKHKTVLADSPLYGEERGLSMGSEENRRVLKEELQQLQRFAADDVPTMEDQHMYSLASRRMRPWIAGATFILTLLLLRRHLRW